MHNICILNYTKTALSTTIAANIRQRIPTKPLQIDHPHNLATQGTQDKENQTKNTTQYVIDTTCASKHTHSVNKT